MSYINAVRKNDDVYVWSRTESSTRELNVYPAPWYFYVQDDDGEHQSIYGDRVQKVSFKSGKDFYAARDDYKKRGVRMFETDITPELRLLSDMYHNKPAGTLNTTFYDIEVDYDPEIGFSSAKDPYAPINAISLFHTHENRLLLLIIPPESWEGETAEDLYHEMNALEPLPTTYKIDVQLCENEFTLLTRFVAEIQNSDVLCGWNSDMFDAPYIGQRVSRTLGKAWLKKLSFPECREPTFEEIELAFGGTGVIMRAQGRVYLDYMRLYKKYEPGERFSYSLEAIEQEVGLGLPKLSYEGSLAGLYRSNFAWFARYSIRDSEILVGFEHKLGYVDVSNLMCHLSSGLLDHVLGTIKLADLAITNYAHHVLGKVVNDPRVGGEDRSIAGAFVLYPQKGLHEYVASVDINSLYPSSIRSVNISPETLVGQFADTSRDHLKIINESMEEITLELESGEYERRSASDWKRWLVENKFAISGYGTVFDQSKQGIIPAILTDWYDTRKKYQKLKNEAISDMEKIEKRTGKTNPAHMSPEDQRAYADAKERVGYNDRLQYVFKIKLNSLYGAMTNLFFRFFDLRLGESTTGTGRQILLHQCRTVSKVLDGSYDVDFPIYESIDETNEAGLPPESALVGPRFKGEFESESVVYGDTDSTYFKTHATSNEEAIEIGDAVAELINKSYPDFMRRMFLCTEGYDGIIKCGREIVSDRGIFVDKKRYILHLINIDGKPVDKMKVMGLDTKKTTLPKHVSSAINKFIERFLKGEDWNSISQSVVNYKKQLYHYQSLSEIGLPKGIKKLEEYTRLYSMDAGTRLPGHVAAAILYNTMLEEHHDKISPKIISGSKIRVYRLKNTMRGRFTSIALPSDLDEVPSWFTEEITPLIDIDGHIERLVDNPISNIITAIGKLPPSDLTLMADEAFEY